MRRIFLDTEWTAAPWSGNAELMWVGLADEQGHSWYGISSEVVIDPTTNRFISGAFNLIDKDEPRWPRKHLAQAVRDFCGAVDEFWAWVPSIESFTAYSRLGDQAAAAFQKHWDIDLQMLKALVSPWPAGWPAALNDLNKAAAAAGVQIPPRANNHLHPRVHAEWNRQLFGLIDAAKGSAA
jgi:hypothetical protein